MRSLPPWDLVKASLEARERLGLTHATTAQGEGIKGLVGPLVAMQERVWRVKLL